MATELDKYLIERLDRFDEKLDNVFKRFEEKMDAHSKDDAVRFAKVEDKLFDMNAAVSGLKVKSSIFGIFGGLLAGFLVLIKSKF
jgi:hypothetical protein